MSNPGPRGIIPWFTRNPVAANLLMFCFFIGGFVTIPSIPLQAFPPFPPKSISIAVAYSAGSAEVVEKSITKEIEAVLSGVRGIKKILSTTTRDGASFTIIKKDDYNLDSLLREVKIKVDSIDNFPHQAEKPDIEKQRWQDSIATISLFGQTSHDNLQKLAYQIRDELLAQSAINKVNINGIKQREISIELNESVLQSYGLSLQDVASKIAQESTMNSGGVLKSENKKITLATDNQAYSANDFSKITILSTEQGGSVFLGDIANVRDSYVDSLQRIRFNGYPAISLQLIDSENGDIATAAKQAQKVIEKFKQDGSIPSSITVKLWDDKSIYIKNRLDLLIKNGLMGMFLICIVLSFFLNYKLAFWVSIGVPVAMAGTLITMSNYALGYTINELTTFGLIVALGILVDDAIIVGESIFTTREEQGETVSSTIKGVQDVATPVTFGVLTTIVAFSPLAFITGDFGQIFGTFAIVVMVSLFFSLVESKLILPAHLNTVSRHKNSRHFFLVTLLEIIQQKNTTLLNSFKLKIYTPAMQHILKAPSLVCIFFIGLLICSMAMIYSGRVRVVFFPDIVNSVLTANVSMQQEAGDKLTIAKALETEAAIFDVNEELKQKYKLDISPLEVVQTIILENLFSITVQVDKTVPFKEAVTLWEEKVTPIEGSETTNFSYSDVKLPDIDITIRGNNIEKINDTVQILTNALKFSPGIYNIKSSNSPNQAQLKIELNQNARNLGIYLSDLTDQIRNGFYGYEVQRFQDDYDELKVMVRYNKKNRQYIDDILDTMIRTPTGDFVQLNSVAEITAKYAPANIDRVDGCQIVSITANTDKQITSPWKSIAYLKENFFPVIMQKYPNIKISVGGEVQEEKEAKSSLLSAFIVTLFAIYGLLAIPLKSYVKPLYVMVVIPFGIVGAIWGHWLFNTPVSLLSLFGVIALCGIVVNDSLLLISEYSHTQINNSISAIITASCKRMRAIILTSITTVAGLAPLLFETSEQAQYLIPAAISMVFGVIFSTTITLVLVPAIVQAASNIELCLKKYF